MLSLMLIKDVITDNRHEEVSHKVKRFLLKFNKQQMHEITKKLRMARKPEEKKELLYKQHVLSTQRKELNSGW